MDSKSDRVINGIPRWSAPWAAGWSDMDADGQRNARDRLHVLPKNSQRRIQVIGVAASSLAATVWLLAIAWLWPAIT